MQQLTNEELAFIHRTCRAEGDRTKRKRTTRIGLWILLFGATLIVAPAAVDLFRDNITKPEFLKTAGFGILLVGVGLIQYEFARYTAMAESAISKLYKSSFDSECKPVNES